MQASQSSILESLKYNMESFTILSEEQWYTLPEAKEPNFRQLIGERKKGRIRNKAFSVTDSNEIRVLGRFLNNSAMAFSHSDYHTGRSWKTEGTIENMIWTFKNDVEPFPERLPDAQRLLSVIIAEDLPRLIEQVYPSR